MRSWLSLTRRAVVLAPLMQRIIQSDGYHGTVFRARLQPINEIVNLREHSQ